MGLPFFVNCSFLIQRVIYFETAPLFSLFFVNIMNNWGENPILLLFINEIM